MSRERYCSLIEDGQRCNKKGVTLYWVKINHPELEFLGYAAKVRCAEHELHVMGTIMVKSAFDVKTQTWETVYSKLRK